MDFVGEKQKSASAEPAVFDRWSRFLDYLMGLRESGDRGALASLRRGLGYAPGEAVEMYPYVMPYLPADVQDWEIDAAFLIAALFAYHPDPGGVGNMGDHFRQARDPQGDDTALERRFSVLLAAHPDDLPFHLRQAVSFLKSRQRAVPVNWPQLLRDVLAWGHPDRYVQRQWARAFWGYRAAPSSEDQSQQA